MLVWKCACSAAPVAQCTQLAPNHSASRCPAPLTRVEAEAAEQVGEVGRRLVQRAQQQLQAQPCARVIAAAGAALALATCVPSKSSVLGALSCCDQMTKEPSNGGREKRHGIIESNTAPAGCASSSADAHVVAALNSASCRHAAKPSTRRASSAAGGAWAGHSRLSTGEHRDPQAWRSGTHATGQASPMLRVTGAARGGKPGGLGHLAAGAPGLAGGQPAAPTPSAPPPEEAQEPVGAKPEGCKTMSNVRLCRATLLSFGAHNDWLKSMVQAT